METPYMDMTSKQVIEDKAIIDFYYDRYSDYIFNPKTAH